MTAIKIGDVIDLADHDYKYGTGRLILRVTRLGNEQSAADGDWVDLDGLELRPDGTQLGVQPRQVGVRVTRSAISDGREPRDGTGSRRIRIVGVLRRPAFEPTEFALRRLDCHPVSQQPTQSKDLT
jgi:hypothetical protein